MKPILETLDPATRETLITWCQTERTLAAVSQRAAKPIAEGGLNLRISPSTLSRLQASHNIADSKEARAQYAALLGVECKKLRLLQGPPAKTSNNASSKSPPAPTPPSPNSASPPNSSTAPTPSPSRTAASASPKNAKHASPNSPNQPPSRPSKKPTAASTSSSAKTSPKTQSPNPPKQPPLSPRRTSKMGN
jgi:hypothetical protein